MADKTRSEGFDGSTDDLITEIRRMEKEKEELEKKNRERQQLEQRLKQLKGNVSSLRSGKNTTAESSVRSVLDDSPSNPLLNTSLEESQARLRSLHGSILDSPLASTSFREEDTANRSFEEYDDDVMTEQHKQALRENRDVLVENMTPADLFNDLISKKILSNADVSRIKEKNTVESVNEELLNILVRRSDRAFYVFVSSLRRTLQGWLANRLDPPAESKGKRKRKTGELNVDVECEKVLPRSKKRFTCTCQEVEEQILIMAKVAFFHIRRRDGTAASFEQFKKELHHTNEALKDSMEILHSLKLLCRHGDLSDLSEGSVRFTIRCSSFASCQRLWEEYQSGAILETFEKGVITPSLLKICGAKRIHLRVKISKLEYLTCALELGREEQTPIRCFQAQRKARPAKSRHRSKQRLRFAMTENLAHSRPEGKSVLKPRVFQEISPNILSEDVPRLHSRASLDKFSLFERSACGQPLFMKFANDKLKVTERIPQSHQQTLPLPSENLKCDHLISKYSPVYKTRSKTIARQCIQLCHRSTNSVAGRRLQYSTTSGYNLRCRSLRV